MKCATKSLQLFLFRVLTLLHAWFISIYGTKLQPEPQDQPASDPCLSLHRPLRKGETRTAHHSEHQSAGAAHLDTASVVTAGFKT